MGDSSNANDQPSPWASPGFTPPSPAQPPPGPAQPPPGPAQPPPGPAQPPPPPAAPSAEQGSEAPEAPPAPGGPAGPYTFPTLAKLPLEPLSVVSLVTSPLAPIGLATGIAAVRRINRTPKRGKGLAATGIILSSLFLAAAVLALGTFALDGTFARMREQPVAGDVPATRTVAPVNLDVGNCVVTLPVTGDVGEVTLTPCAEDHQYQVIGRIAVDGDPYPGAAELFTRAGAACQATFDALTPPLDPWPQGFAPWHLVPSEENWASGERNIICLARSTAGPVTSDLLGG